MLSFPDAWTKTRARVRAHVRGRVADPSRRRRQSRPRVQGGRRHTALHRAREAARASKTCDGNTYIDYVMSWGPLIHGHAPKGLLKALSAAAARGTSFGAPTELETRLAQRVATLMPSMERVRFVSSGTEAAMSAIRVARAATKRDKIVKFEGCYHGHARRVPRAGRLRRDDARRADQPRRPGGGGGRHDPRALQRSGLGRSGSADARTAIRSPPSSWSRLPATSASCRRARGSSRGCARSAIATASCWCSTK